MDVMAKIRLDRFLSEQKIVTRSQSKAFLKRTQVCVNGQRITDGSFKIMADKDLITIDGQQIIYKKYDYIMLYKPKGVVTATSDNLDCTVIDLLGSDVPRKSSISPVGRLDKDTTGLLLLTDDGDLNHRLLSPRHHVKKTYIATLDKKLEDIEAAKKRCLSGIDIGDEKLTLPAVLEETDDEYTFILTITEGRFHQVKRMFEKLGSRVVALKRVSMGKLSLDENLKPGEYRFLTQDEINCLREDWS